MHFISVASNGIRASGFWRGSVAAVVVVCALIMALDLYDVTVICFAWLWTAIVGREISTHSSLQSNLCFVVISQKLDEATAEVVSGINFIFTRLLLVWLHLPQALISNLVGGDVAPLLHHIWAQSKSLDLRPWRWTNIKRGFKMTFLLQSILEPLKLGGFEIVLQKKWICKR